MIWKLTKQIHRQTSEPPVITWQSVNYKARDKLFHSAIRGFKREKRESFCVFFFNEEKFSQADWFSKGCGLSQLRGRQTQGRWKTKVASGDWLSSTIRCKTTVSQFIPDTPLMLYIKQMTNEQLLNILGTHSVLCGDLNGKEIKKK